MKSYKEMVSAGEIHKKGDRFYLHHSDYDEKLPVARVLFSPDEIDDLIFACEHIARDILFSDDKAWIDLLDKFTKAKALLTLSELENQLENVKGEYDEDRE